MLPEYDFTQGVRGKHHKSYGGGYVVRVRKPYGSVSVQHFTLEEGTVMLEPDVREYFPIVYCHRVRGETRVCIPLFFIENTGA